MMLPMTTCHLNNPFSCLKFPGQLLLTPDVKLPNSPHTITLQHDKYLTIEI